MFLTRDDLQRLTCKVRYSAQRRALDQLGIHYLKAPNGEPLVRPADLDGKGAKARNSGPKWERIAA